MQTDDRVIYEIDIPEEFRTKNGETAVGMVELSTKEEKNVRKRCRAQPENIQDELVKESILEISGRDVRGARHEVDKLWDHALSRLRILLTGAYQKINFPDDDAVDGFLNGRRIKTT